jgi:hypothetical protein
VSGRGHPWQFDESRYPERDRSPSPAVILATAKENGLEAVGLARTWDRHRGAVKASPLVQISGTESGHSRHGETTDPRRQWPHWSEDARDAYYTAFLSELMAGNVALVQRGTPENFDVIAEYVVDLSAWQRRGRRSRQHRPGDVYRANPERPDSPNWKPRSRWLRVQRALLNPSSRP